MPRQNVPLLAFNRGIISQKALARVDLERMPFSADTQRNWIPDTLGSMSLRPGFQYIGTISFLTEIRHIPFVNATDDAAILGFISGSAHVWKDDVLVTPPSVSTTLTNGNFATDVSGWTDNDGPGLVTASTWASPGYLSLRGDDTNYASRLQQITVSGPDTGVLHVLRLIVTRGPINIRIGTTSGNNDYVDAIVETGKANIEFTPAGNFWIELRSNLNAVCLVDNLTFSGIYSVSTPYTTSADRDNIRTAQSADVVFVACKGKAPLRIERSGDYSWASVYYEPDDGPFDVINITPVTLKPSFYNADINLTASDDIFTTEDVGRLFKLDSLGQLATRDISSDDVSTGHIKVTGIGTSRDITISITEIVATAVCTATLQRSIGGPGVWEDVLTYATIPTSVTYNDTLDNQVIYYRLHVATGNYTSGVLRFTMTHTGGSTTGIVRVHTFNSSTSVSGRVIQPLGSLEATTDWYSGLWSAKTGYPTSVALFEGRLWWAGKNYFYGSESDAYESFGTETIGDAAAIIRQIGFGPIDTINWLLPLQRLLAGTEGNVITARSTSFDEPLTPTNFNMKDATTHGSDLVDAVKVDTYGAYVHRSKRRVMELNFNGQNASYTATDATVLVPELAQSGIVRLAVQRMPDTRLHAILADGTAMLMIVDSAEDVRAWVTVDTDGLIEDVVILPGDVEDQVYYSVNRSGVRYLEKWALKSECEGGSLNKQADSFIISTGQVITGLDHLDGETVIVWADGVDRGTFTVASNQIDLGASYTDVVVGLPYNATFKSSKLAYAAGMGTALTQRKKLTHLALILYKTHCQGVQYGTDAAQLDELPLYEAGALVADDTIHDTYDSDSFEVNGSWGSDERLILTAAAPRPVTVLATIPTIVTHDKG